MFSGTAAGNGKYEMEYNFIPIGENIYLNISYLNSIN